MSQTYRQTNGQMDRSVLRAARSQLKMSFYSISILTIVLFAWHGLPGVPVSSAGFMQFSMSISSDTYLSWGSNWAPLKCARLTILPQGAPLIKIFTLWLQYNTMILKQKKNKNKITICPICHNVKTIAFCPQHHADFVFWISSFFNIYDLYVKMKS